MTDTPNNSDNEKFKCLPLSSKTEELCIIGCETPRGEDTKCYDCALLLCPFGFMYDVVSLPFRSSYHVYKCLKFHYNSANHSETIVTEHNNDFEVDTVLNTKIIDVEKNKNLNQHDLIIKN